MNLTLVWGLTVVFGSYDASEVDAPDASESEKSTTVKGGKRNPSFLTPSILVTSKCWSNLQPFCLLRTRFCCCYRCPNELDREAGLGSFGALLHPRASKHSHLDYVEKSNYSYCSYRDGPFAMCLHSVSGKNHKILHGITC